MKKYILLSLGFFIIISCNENKKKDLEKSKILDKKIIVSKKKKANDLLSKIINDTVIIESKCAVIYEPTQKYIEKSKKNIGEENFYVGADDFLFYISETNEYLESKNIKIVTTENDKILKFISNDKRVTIIKTDLEKEMFGIYLFDPKQTPKKINITAISDEFESYME